MAWPPWSLGGERSSGVKGGQMLGYGKIAKERVDDVGK